MPTEIDYGQYRSTGELFESATEKYRDRPAYTNMGRTITFGDLERSTRAFGAWLQSRRLSRGARVAVMMPNCLQYPVCVFGILRAGHIVVNVNPLYTARELEHQLKDSGAEAIVILENFARTLQEVLPRTPVKHVALAALGDLLGAKGLLVNFVLRKVKKMVPAFDLPAAQRFNEVLAEGAGKPLASVDVGPEDIAFLQYTGGTTGVSKGAMLLHRNIVANIAQVEGWLSLSLGGETPTIITALPLYHIYSLTVNCLLILRMGGYSILITNPRDIPGFVKELAKHRYNMITGVNTLFNALLHNPEFGKLDFSALRVASGGGMAVQKAVADKWQQVTGTTLLEGYGLTETSPVATMNPFDLKGFSGSIGVPIPSTDISIRDGERELDIGEEGELCVRGPQVMQGYWNMPEETAKTLDRDGWLHTGDIAVLDEDGFVHIVDRKKDMIIVSGFKVFPNEIEAVLTTHEAVLEAGCIGVPDERSGQAVKAYVVARQTLTVEQVRAFCREHLTPYKVPKYVEFRDALPKTNIGKILRRALADEASAGVRSDLGSGTH